MAPTLTKPVTAGDVITSAEPLVHIVFSEFMSKFCSNCLNSSEELKFCLKCLQIYYCDQSCQTNDWKYHKNECKVFTHEDFKLNVCQWYERLLLRLWLCIKSDDTFATRSHQLVVGSDVCLNDMKVDVLDVIRNNFVDNEDFHEFVVVCDHFTAYGLEFENKELLQWFKFILHSMYVCTQTIAPNGPTGANVAAGLYIQFASLTHSVVPNCDIVHNNGLSFELKAMKCIAIGEPLALIPVTDCRPEPKTTPKPNTVPISPWAKNKPMMYIKCPICERMVKGGLGYGLHMKDHRKNDHKNDHKKNDHKKNDHKKNDHKNDHKKNDHKNDDHKKNYKYYRCHMCETMVKGGMAYGLHMYGHSKSGSKKRQTFDTFN